MTNVPDLTAGLAVICIVYAMNEQLPERNGFIWQLLSDNLSTIITAHTQILISQRGKGVFTTLMVTEDQSAQTLSKAVWSISSYKTYSHCTVSNERHETTIYV